jgi:hypothetical protein
LLPSGDFADEALGVVDSAIEAPAAEHADLDLDHVKPTGMLGGGCNGTPGVAEADMQRHLSGQPTLGPPDERDARTKRPPSASTRRRPKHPNPSECKSIFEPAIAFSLCGCPDRFG